jgi:hypothetical protein
MNIYLQRCLDRAIEKHAAKSPPKAEDFAEEKRGEIEKLFRTCSSGAAGTACSTLEQDYLEKEY